MCSLKFCYFHLHTSNKGLRGETQRHVCVQQKYTAVASTVAVQKKLTNRINGTEHIVSSVLVFSSDSEARSTSQGKTEIF